MHVTQLLYTSRGRIDKQDGESPKFMGGLDRKLFHKYETWSIISYLRYINIDCASANHLLVVQVMATINLQCNSLSQIHSSVFLG